VPIARSVIVLSLSVAAASASACCCSAPFNSAGTGGLTRSTAPLGVGVLAPSPAPPTDAATDAQFRHVNFQVASGIVLGIRYLRGTMASATHGGPIAFDDKSSFVIHIDTADVALSSDVLGHLMNEHVFAYPTAPLRGLSFSIVGAQLRLRGTLHKVVDIPFDMTSVLSVTSEGLIRVRPVTLKICSLNGKGLMSALGIELADLLDLSKATGATVVGNALLLDPNHLLPPPMIQGRLVSVGLEGGQLVQHFGHSGSSGAALAAMVPADSGARNYMYFRGGTLQFGKLFMVRADMLIVDTQPETPFAFSIDGYLRQLVAGYSRTHDNLSLEVFMPDYTSLGAAGGDRP
jgi:hypothetical protein